MPESVEPVVAHHGEKPTSKIFRASIGDPKNLKRLNARILDQIARVCLVAGEAAGAGE